MNSIYKWFSIVTHRSLHLYIPPRLFSLVYDSFLLFILRLCGSPLLKKRTQFSSLSTRTIKKDPNACGRCFILTSSLPFLSPFISPSVYSHVRFFVRSARPFFRVLAVVRVRGRLCFFFSDLLLFRVFLPPFNRSPGLLSVSLSVCPFACLFICISVRLSIRVSVYFFFRSFVHPFFPSFICPSVRSPACPSVCLSVCSLSVRFRSFVLTLVPPSVFPSRYLSVFPLACLLVCLSLSVR